MRKKIRKPIAVGMSLALLCASMPATNAAQAASNPKLSTSSFSLTVGQSKKITVKGASGTVKWSSSNKKIVTVAKTTKKTAKVTAKKTGTAQIKAKAGKNVLKCKVTVKKADQNTNTTTQAPNTQAPATNVPVTNVPATNVPVTNAPASNVPVTNAPVVSDTNAPVVSDTNAPVVSVTNAPTADATTPSEQRTSAPDRLDTNTSNPQESSAPETSASVQPTANTTEMPTPTGTSTEDPSGNKVLAILKFSEDGKTVEGVENKDDATYAIIPDSVTSIGDEAFIEVPHIEYHGSATGAPWGADSMN